jgi:hypothetical protein
VPASEPKRYFVETNRSSRTTYQNCRRLERHGYEVVRLAHQPTTIIVVDHECRDWRTSRAVLAKLADTPEASVVVVSCQTGNIFQCDRRSNQPNRWIRKSPD